MSPYWLPAAITLALIGVHLLSGGPEVVRPLLASRELPPDVVHLLYLCWHAVTVLLVACLVAYAGAALDPGFRPYVVAATVVVGALSVLSLAIVYWKRQSHRKMPQWIAFLVLTLSGVWALS
jgi:hypothetical protein